MTWDEIQQNMNKPIYDVANKKWRVLDGYKQVNSERCISFTDLNNWVPFKEKDYLKGVIE